MKSEVSNFAMFEKDEPEKELETFISSIVISNCQEGSPFHPSLA